MNILERWLLKLRFNVWARIKINSFTCFDLSHSQFGEDMIVRYLTLETKDGIYLETKKGFYVDIGAHHPVFYSNTYYLYCKGWRGINIDGIPGVMESFNVLRPRDINLELLLYPQNTSEKIEYYILNEPAYNTLDKDMAKQAISRGYKLLEKRQIQTSTLEDILDSYLPKDTEIDLMTIDIEGLDEAILMSNDWNKYKPKILIFEKHNVDFADIVNLPIVQYLSSYGYKIDSKCGPSIIMKLEVRDYF
jgi:hypothetical protein